MPLKRFVLMTDRPETFGAVRYLADARGHCRAPPRGTWGSIVELE